MIQLTLTPYATVADVPVEHWLAEMRVERNRLLSESDWTQVADDPTGMIAEWAAYRQALRDFPDTWTPAPVADFPTSPDGLEA